MRPAIVVLFSLSCGLCQTPSAFDAASIKPARPGDVRGSTFQFTPGGGLQVTNGTLTAISKYPAGRAGSMRTGSISLPGVHQGEDQGSAQTRLKLQRLLSARFQLRVHRETKELLVYALGLAGGSPGLTALDAQKPVSAGAGIRTSCSQMIGMSATMSNLTFMLSRQLERPVIDRAGISGRYDFQFDRVP